jgi:hypothetical protein
MSADWLPTVAALAGAPHLPVPAGGGPLFGIDRSAAFLDGTAAAGADNAFLWRQFTAAKYDRLPRQAQDVRRETLRRDLCVFSQLLRRSNRARCR